MFKEQVIREGNKNMYSKPIFNEKQKEFIDLTIIGLLKTKFNTLKVDVKEEEVHVTYAGKGIPIRTVFLPNIMDSKDFNHVYEHINKLKEMVSTEHTIENLSDSYLLGKGSIIYLPNNQKLKVVDVIESGLTIAVSPIHEESLSASQNTYYIPFELVIGSKVKTFD